VCVCVCVCVCVYSARVSRCVGERRPIIDELRRLRPDDDRTTPSRRQRFHGRRPDRPHRVQAWTDSSSAIAGCSVEIKQSINQYSFIIRSFMLLTVIFILLVFHHPLLFHSRLKTCLFCKSLPLQPFLFFYRTDYVDSSDFYCYF